MKTKKSVKENMIRGCKLIALGYILNLARFTLPILVAGPPYLSGQDPISMLLTVDILQLAGVY